ncbi:hypothetical protein [Peribacillus kribbensis]|uniref:hypothetical protein n=1 Tax=Peribacillus kribbensis TaxID=356658 RepID=UPI0003F6F4FF|nr:hypothetical protein [Peribacillus kribbensis]
MDSSQRRGDAFAEFMFGRKPEAPSSKKETSTAQKLTDLTANIDLDQLFTHVDSIMNIYSQFKPAIKQLSPVIQLFKKKK